MVLALLLVTQMAKHDVVESNLKQALASVPGVTFKNEEGTLVVRYRTRIVNVRPASKSAQPPSVMAMKRPEEQPSETGFKL